MGPLALNSLLKNSCFNKPLSAALGCAANRAQAPAASVEAQTCSIYSLPATSRCFTSMKKSVLCTRNNK